jgi:hypothetical protein
MLISFERNSALEELPSFILIFSFTFAAFIVVKEEEIKRRIKNPSGTKEKERSFFISTMYYLLFDYVVSIASHL